MAGSALREPEETEVAVTNAEGNGGMLAKGLGLLVVLGGFPDGVGVSRLAREAGIPTSTAHRLLWAMVPIGFVHFDAGNHRYSLGLRVFELSHRVSLVRTLSEVALPVMRAVAADTTEQTLMAVLEDTEMVYLEKVEGQHPVQNRAAVGQRGPIHCTAMGKSLLAFLSEDEREALMRRIRLARRTPHSITQRTVLRRELQRIRESGFADNEEENELGVRSVAVPVLDPRGRPACAICVTCPTYRVSRQQLHAHIPMLQRRAREIELLLPWGGSRNSATGTPGGKIDTAPTAPMP